MWLLLVLPVLAAAVFYWFRRKHAVASETAASTPYLVDYGPSQAPRAEAVDLNELVSQMEEPLRRALPSAIRLRVELDPELPPVRADRGEVQLMIGHLAVSCRDAMPHGGTLTIRTRGSSQSAAGDVEDAVLLEVEDTGAGVNDGLLTRIFDPPAMGRKGAGLRLGLPTVQTLAYHNRGTMRIESMAHGGTRMTVCLRRAREFTASDALALAARGTETILVVEDEDAVRSIVRRTLQGAGYSTIEAPDPLVALDVIARRKQDIDLILSDIMMHHMRGTELVRRVRKQWPLARVLYMSGYAEDPAVVQDVADQGALLVPKPFTTPELLGAVRRALDSLPIPQEPPSGA